MTTDDEIYDISATLEPEEQEAGAVAFRYGGQSFVPGIPARDLTAEEADAIGRDMLRGIVCANSGEPLYKEVT
jgi:hypothetical protein